MPKPTVKSIFQGVNPGDEILITLPVCVWDIDGDCIRGETVAGSIRITDDSLRANPDFAPQVSYQLLKAKHARGDVVYVREDPLTAYVIVALSHDSAIIGRASATGLDTAMAPLSTLERWQGDHDEHLALRIEHFNLTPTKGR